MNRTMLKTAMLFLISFIFLSPGFATIGTLLMTNNTATFGAGPLFLYDLKTGATDTLYKGMARGACFSPDGYKVAFSEDNNKIKILDLFTRQIVSIGTILPKSQILSWAHDGCIYYPPKWGKVLLKINVQTEQIDTVYKLQGTYIPATPTDTMGFFTGNVAANGKKGCFTIDNDQRGNRAVAIDFEANTEIMMNGSGSTGHLSCQGNISPDGQRVVFANYNHSGGYIKPFQNNSLTYQVISGVPSIFMTQFAYNSNDDIVCKASGEFSTYHYNIPSQTLTWLIRGPSAWTIDVRGWVLDTLTPSAPTGLTAVPTDNTMPLSWTAPTSGTLPTEYIIERNGKKVGSSLTTTFTDKDLTASTAYSYSIYGRTRGVKLSAPLQGSFSTTADLAPPKLVGAYAFGTIVDLIFSEPLSAASVTTVSNYTITPSLAVSAAVLRAPKRVRLTTANTNTLTNAIISVSGVKDLALNTASGTTDSLSIVSNLWVSSGRTCGWAAIDSGTLYWTDDDAPAAYMTSRSPVYSDLPFLQTSINDGTVNADSAFLRFNLNRRMMVMIIGGAPVWCNTTNGWTATSDKIGSWSVSTKVFEPGQVILKGRGATKYSTYVVGFRNWDSSLTLACEGHRLLQARKTSLRVAPSPAPSGSRMTISYPVSSAGHVRLAVYNTQGRLMNTLRNEKQDLGGHHLIWTGVDAQNRRLPNGVYFLTLSIDNKALKTERFVLIQ